jgi:hypothetical protein
VIESAHDVPLVTSYRFGAERQRAAPVASNPPSFDPRPYANKLRTLVGVAQGHGIALLFVTQQTTWASRVDPTAKDWHWLLRVDDVRYEEDTMDAALERMNDVMREIANSGHVALYDLARQMPKSTAFFLRRRSFQRQRRARRGNGDRRADTRTPLTTAYAPRDGSGSSATWPRPGHATIAVGTSLTPSRRSGLPH